MTCPKPVIGILANHLVDDGVHRNWLRWKYIDAAERFADVHAVLIPTQTTHHVRDGLVARLDGVILTGDESNLDPDEFQPDATVRHGPDYVHLVRDRYRDRAARLVLHDVLRLGLPLLAICRGLQELNVVLGGTLHACLFRTNAPVIHHENTALPRDRQYDAVHDLDLEPDGILSRILGRDRIRVNSLHTQGIDRLAPGLRAEARASDSLIEAASVWNAPRLQLGVQWHPEWHVATDPIGQAIFESFGEDCDRVRHQSAN